MREQIRGKIFIIISREGTVGDGILTDMAAHIFAVTKRLYTLCDMRSKLREMVG